MLLDLRAMLSLEVPDDRTRTRFTYIRRTRKSVPREYDELARLGGTGAMEVIP